MALRSNVDVICDVYACSLSFPLALIRSSPRTPHSKTAENLKNQALISAIAKPCPCCASPVEKAGGCNQMRCHACGSHFCWLCGKLVDGGTFPSHYQWWNLGGCPNMQIQESAEPPPASHVRLIKICSAVQVRHQGKKAKRPRRHL